MVGCPWSVGRAGGRARTGRRGGKSSVRRHQQYQQYPTKCLRRNSERTQTQTEARESGDFRYVVRGRARVRARTGRWGGQSSVRRRQQYPTKSPGTTVVRCRGSVVRGIDPGAARSTTGSRGSPARRDLRQQNQQNPRGRPWSGVRGRWSGSGPRSGGAARAQCEGVSNISNISRNAFGGVPLRAAAIGALPPMGDKTPDRRVGGESRERRGGRCDAESRRAGNVSPKGETAVSPIGETTARARCGRRAPKCTARANATQAFAQHTRSLALRACAQANAGHALACASGLYWSVVVARTVEILNQARIWDTEFRGLGAARRSTPPSLSAQRDPRRAGIDENFSFRRKMGPATHCATARGWAGEVARPKRGGDVVLHALVGGDGFYTPRGQE